MSSEPCRRAAAIARAAALAITVGLAGCSGNRTPVGRTVDDASITSTVKSRFAEDRIMRAETIQVGTSNGTVVLSGEAGSNLEKTNAESITMKVPGVKLVRNELVVKP